MEGELRLPIYTVKRIDTVERNLKMTSTFTPKLYMLGDQNNIAVEHIFGKENVELIKLDATVNLSDDNADQLFDLSCYLYGRSNHLLIVKNFDEKSLTMLRIAGLKYYVFKVSDEESSEELEYWRDNYDTFISWGDHADDFLSAQETIINDSESLLDEESYSALYNSNYDLVDYKNNFDDIYREGFRNAFEAKYLFRTY